MGQDLFRRTQNGEEVQHRTAIRALVTVPLIENQIHLGLGAVSFCFNRSEPLDRLADAAECFRQHTCTVCKRDEEDDKANFQGGQLRHDSSFPPEL